nr:colipase-like protein 2 isoform X4 [Equus asinus]
MAAAAAILAGVLLPCWGAFPQLNKGLLKAGCLIRSQMDLKALHHPAGGSADQGSHQHHVPLPHGLDLRLQGPGLSPPVPFALEEDAGCHCPPPSLPWGQRPWASESCSKFSS